jgi:hypothetical protein
VPRLRFELACRGTGLLLRNEPRISQHWNCCGAPLLRRAGLVVLTKDVLTSAWCIDHEGDLRNEWRCLTSPFLTGGLCGLR